MELSTIIVDATYNYILGNITAEGFQKEVEKWRASGGNLIIKEYSEAELGIEK
jgi:putative aldouronate transport system substrate-binding protein